MIDDLIGFVEDMPNEEYHGMSGVSKSGLDKVHRSPAHYKYSNKKTSTRAMDIGTAIHTAILEPARFESEYFITNDTARTSKNYKEKKAIYGGDKTLTAQEGKKIIGMVESVRSNSHAMAYLSSDGKPELSAFCIDPETGIKIRARYDWITAGGVVVDVKKTQDIRASKFSKSVYEYRYHVQEAMYSFIYEQITGQKLKAFYFLAVEEEAPNSCEMFLLDDLSREAGEYYFRRDLRVYAECMDSGEWPAPNNGDGVIDMPNWAISNYENEIEVIV